MAENNNGGGLGIGYLLLFGFLAYAALKFYHVQKEIEKDLNNRGSLKPGVSYYCNLAVSQRPHQVLAAQATNCDMATAAGYSPAFGPCENMPCQRTEIFW
jgi:hypothetical protein